MTTSENQEINPIALARGVCHEFLPARQNESDQPNHRKGNARCNKKY